jgi:hypothetical protein
MGNENGWRMSTYPVPLVPNNVQSAMQLATISMLGLPTPTSAKDPAYSAVRVGWQQLGQPSQFINNDVVYVRCVTVDVPAVNRVRNRVLLPNPADTRTPPQTLILLTSYTRVWQTFWEFYGPNGFDHARAIHSALFTQSIHDTFAALNLNLYWVPDSSCPRRVPYYEDEQWWERMDFEAQFNEFVQEPLIVPIMASVEVKTYESTAGEIADYTVELQQ